MNRIDLPARRVLVLGATGGTGRHVVEQALASGLEVTVLVRTPESLGPAARAARVIKGDVLADASALASAVSNQDVVISTLGLGKSLKSNGFISRAAPAIVAAAQSGGVKRLLFTSALGVGVTRRDAPLVPRLIFATLLRDIYADKEAGETAIVRSALDWTIVYPGLLTDGPRTGRYRAGERLALSGFPKISRADVAEFLLRQIDDPTFVRRGVLIAP